MDESKDWLSMQGRPLVSRQATPGVPLFERYAQELGELDAGSAQGGTTQADSAPEADSAPGSSLAEDSDSTPVALPPRTSHSGTTR
jgi:hypothetical protein